MPLSAEQRDALEGLLDRERSKLVRRLRRFGAELGAADVAGFSQHMAEDAAALTAMETAALMASEEGRRLALVNRALDRLVRAPASYGVCRSCEAEVGYDRLEAIPYTELCVACKRAEEEGVSDRSE